VTVSRTYYDKVLPPNRLPTGANRMLAGRPNSLGCPQEFPNICKDFEMLNMKSRGKGVFFFISQ
jgi:hypothetical protein